MICGLIGSTKVAEVHLGELIKNGAKEIVIISRSKKKSLKIYKKYKKNLVKLKFQLQKLIFYGRKNLI